MLNQEYIPIVDLFAGPGGLGEGFSSVRGDPFRIIVSAEMDSHAHETLRLRAFYRLLKRTDGASLDSYYKYCNGHTDQPYDETNFSLWAESGEEARQLELGEPKHDTELDDRINSHKIGPNSPWVLIGGPPCQAYSIVGRARNRGKEKYVAEDDHRHFLYKEYLRIIQKYRPAVFVMENVKGILTARINGKKIFETILQDLSDPDRAFPDVSGGRGYRIHSLTSQISFKKGDDPTCIDARDFIIKAEEHGIPQARHRVILIGVREDLANQPTMISKETPPTVGDIIGSMPKVRSTLSKEFDSSEVWSGMVKSFFQKMADEVLGLEELKDLHSELTRGAKETPDGLGYGALRLKKQQNDTDDPLMLSGWYHDPKIEVWLNHQARGHMQSDLKRYAYAAAFAKALGKSPIGHGEFNLEGLRPNHGNWESGKFADRFRVQLNNRPATTITSHISKDGHYFIHPDPLQCRSLTVREAARLQTFPDNYFFQGNRTQQFHQVGNAVPPMLAKKIGEVVASLLKKASETT